MGFSFGRNKDRGTCSAAEEEIRRLRAALEAVELRVAALEAAARLPAKQPASNTADVATDTAGTCQIVTSATAPSPVAARVEPAQEAGAARLSAAQLSRLHTEAHKDEVTAVAISRGFSPAGASRRSAPASETPRFVAAGVGGRLLLRGADGRPLAPPVELPAAAEALSFSAGGPGPVWLWAAMPSPLEGAFLLHSYRLAPPPEASGEEEASLADPPYVDSSTTRLANN
mmetsp:Transcript_14904/g.47921  ORF Transcript_14904/g.47921 Transcript_14904/m.47921 type:complete len:229 (-) Transcript_14904:397-1083(-)